MENPYHYRNKVQAAFGRTRGGEIISGVYQSSTHNIVKTDSCLIEDKIADEILELLNNEQLPYTISTGDVTGYDAIVDDILHILEEA